MSKKKAPRVKRLKKGHVWPSVLFLICSVLLSIAASVVFEAIILAYFAKNRMDDIYKDTVSMGRMLYAASSLEEKEKVLDFLKSDPGRTNAIYLIDEDGQILYGFGDATYDLERGGVLQGNLPQECTIYADRYSNYNLVFLTEDSDPDYAKEIMTAALSDDAFNWYSMQPEVFLGDFMSGNKQILHEEWFWLGMEMSDGVTALIKCRMYFYTEDVMLALLLGLLTVVLMFLPALFLFIELVHNIIHQRYMTKILYTDSVTGGRSWMYFEHFAYKTLRSRAKAEKLYALIDLSQTKYRGYCTCHGVREGEELLKKIDKGLTAQLKSSECCARFGQANFGLLLKCRGREECANRVNEIIKQLQQLTDHGNMIFHGGIYFVEPTVVEDGKEIPRRKRVDIAEWFNRASAARATLTDENQIALAVFDQKLLEEQLWEHRVEEKMELALANEEFKVYIQPKYNPVTEQLAGAEALVRWINEEDGFISPGRFIPIFEKNGFITRLDDYMISHVAKLQAGWLAEGKAVVPVSVNVSRAHFANPDLAQHICQLVDAYQLPHCLIEIELTESAFFDDKAALLGTVQELKQLGFDISMDDFGAGYSSLNSLKDLPLDVLKLDAEFFRGEDEEERGEIVVSQAIDLAKKLNMRIVAEGVEKNQVDFLAAHDCDMIQGYYYAKPMPADEYAAKMSDVCDTATRQEPAMIEEKTEQDNCETASLPEANV